MAFCLMGNALGKRSGKEQVGKKAVMNFRPVNAFFKSIPKPQKRTKGVLNRVYVVIFSCFVARKKKKQEKNCGVCERVRVDHILFSTWHWASMHPTGIAREYEIQMQL